MSKVTDVEVSAVSECFLYFHCSMSVCLSAWLYSCEQNCSRMYASILLTTLAQTLIEIGNIGSMVKVTVTENVCLNDEKKIT